MSFKKSIQVCGIYLLAASMLWVPTVAQAEMLSTQKTLQSLTSNVEKREWLTAMVLRQRGADATAGIRRVTSGIDEPGQQHDR